MGRRDPCDRRDEYNHDWASFPRRMPQPQDNFVSLTSMFSVGSGSIGVDLQDVPNEPIRFIVRMFTRLLSSMRVV